MWSGTGYRYRQLVNSDQNGIGEENELILVTNSIVPYMFLSQDTSPQLPLMTVIQLVHVSLVKQAGV